MAKRRSARARGQGAARQRGDRTGRKGPRQAREEAPDLLARDPAARPPRIVITGRPNVGKSTLLNALAHSRVAIVEPTPGVTRDRVSVLATLADRTVELVDTGGIGIVDRQGLEALVEEQVSLAVQQADVVLFLADAREGVVPLDARVADLLRPRIAKVVLLANKVESERTTWNLGEFEALGFGTPLAISAQEHLGLDALEAAILERLPPGPATPRHLGAPELELALVGRMNAGKSSLVNALCLSERMIVSEIPGTTRDAVDVRFEQDGRSVVVIDTAGIRKEKIVQGKLDFYAQRRAERAMRRADVTALVLDASTDVRRLDRRIAAYAVAQHRPVVVVANKWDLRPPGLATRTFRAYLHETLPGLRYAPVVFTSATKGKGLDALMAAAWRIHAQATTRVSTGQLNRLLAAAQARLGPRSRKGRQGVAYYGTQVATAPPTFLLFVNDPKRFDPAWLRFLENRMRAELPFAEVPLKLVLKPRGRDAP